MKPLCRSLAPLFLVACSAAQGLVVPPPEVRPGESYRILFVTDLARDATSADAVDYDAFVSAAAQAVPELAALQTRWRAVVGTPGLSAWQHTETYGSSVEAGVAVYRPDGVRIVDFSSALWRGGFGSPRLALLAAPTITASGQVTGAQRVWTGATFAGGTDPFAPLGSTSCRNGDPSAPNYSWVSANTASASTQLPLYGISDVLTLPDAVHPPGLGPGARYRILLVTDALRDATSTEISDYDAFVRADAEAVENLRLLATQWRAVASTSAVAARAHTESWGAGEGASVPVYRPDGVLVVERCSQLWTAGSAGLLAPPNVTSSGATPSGDRAWSGTYPDGTKASLGSQVLGAGGGLAQAGAFDLLSNSWIWANVFPLTQQKPLYALSDVIVVPGNAQERLRVGSAFNPPVFRRGATSGPVAGQVWDPYVDHTLWLPAATLDFALLSPFVADLPLPGVATGNLLVDPSFHIRMVSAPGAPFLVPCPNDPLVIGAGVSVQGGCLDGGDPALHFANALDIVLGTR